MKRLRQGILLGLLLLLGANFPLTAQDTLSSHHPDLTRSFKWVVGEELFYKVRYAFFTIGTLYFKVEEQDTLHGRPVYHCKMHIKSNTSIPFVPDLDDSYDSFIDEDFYSHKFIAYEKQKGYWLYTLYEMNYENNTIHIYVERHYPADTLVAIDSVATIPGPVQDGISLLYFARAHAKSSSPVEIPVFAFNELKSTVINFTGEPRKVKAKGKEVLGYYLDGKLKFVGIAGIKEGFKGWFSPDLQSIPLHAKMKAIVGHVRVNLEWWKEWDEDGYLAQKE
ncbi:MAG: DUF3108 domain-containing protein [Calditrichaeota bacterium]|nr:MAG: DUF3108 domain-containing protein [Calditrichota bacterium]